MNKQENCKDHLHIIYLCIIFVIVLGFLIVCFCKGRISDYAFQNVSFAATVASILLALISIVLSMNAANTTSNNLVSMSEVERQLNDSLNRLDKLGKVLKRTENKIDKLSLKDNLIPSQMASDSSKLTEKGNVFMIAGSSKNNDYLKFEKVAIEKLSNELGLYDVKRDVALKGDSNLIFDATAKNYDYTYLIEVKICTSPSQAQAQYLRFKSRISEVFKIYNPDSILVYLLFVCKEDNNNEIRSAVKELNNDSNSMFATVFYNASELIKTE